MPILFSNPGLIDLRGLRSFGINAKPLSTNPIGSFGTGSKHAIAVLMRLNHTVVLWRGLDRYTFGLKKVDMRGKEFDFITLTSPDGTEEELPYSTELGKKWEDFTPFRELHSNALDEGGSTTRLPKIDAYVPRPDTTAFIVDGPEIEAAYQNRASIFLTGEPALTTPDLAIHEGRGEHVFYRGIRVLTPQQPSLFTYNLTSETDLTEDRTLKYTHVLEQRVAAAIATSEDERFLRRTLVAPDTTYEHHVGPYWAVNPSETFLRVYTDLVREGNKGMTTRLANAIYAKVRKTPPVFDPVKMSKIQNRQLERAIAFCKTMGWYDEKYPIVIVPHQKGGLLAFAEDNKIVLTTACFDEGIKTVVLALLEEHLHLKHGFSDHTREFQTFLLRMVLGLAEQLTDEPL